MQTIRTHTVRGMGAALDDVDRRHEAHMATAPPWPAHYVGEPTFNRLWCTREIKEELSLYRFLYLGMKTWQWMVKLDKLKVRGDRQSIRDQQATFNRACAEHDSIRANLEFSTARERIDAQCAEEEAQALLEKMKAHAPIAAQLRPRETNKVVAYPRRKSQEVHL